MGIKQVFVCDFCNQDIDDIHPGVIVHGNIYVANPKKVSERGGLVGNNFVDDRGQGLDYEKVSKVIGLYKVKESIYHTTCLASILTPKQQKLESIDEILGRNY